MFREVSVDRGLQVGDRAEEAAADALPGHREKEALDGVEFGMKWKVQRGWRASQASTLGCLYVA